MLVASEEHHSIFANDRAVSLLVRSCQLLTHSSSRKLYSHSSELCVGDIIVFLSSKRGRSELWLIYLLVRASRRQRVSPATCPTGCRMAVRRHNTTSSRALCQYLTGAFWQHRAITQLSSAFSSVILRLRSPPDALTTRNAPLHPVRESISSFAFMLERRASEHTCLFSS